MFSKTFILSFFALILLVTLEVRSDINKAWELFKINNFKDSYTECEKIINSPNKDRTDALILMSIISDISNDYKQSIGLFKEIFNSEQDINPFFFSLFISNSITSIPSYDNDELIELFENLLQTNKLNSTNKVWLIEYLSKDYKFKGDIDKAVEYGNMIRAIYDWQVVGSFENISESGFDLDFGVINHPEPDYVFTDKNGAEVKWFDIVKPFKGRWVNLANYFIARNSIIYAQTFCKSPNNINGQIRVGTSGSLKVWVNDKLVISESEERNNGLDTYISPINLIAGNNRIVLQVGNSEINYNNFIVRITDNNGNPVDNLTFSTTYYNYPKLNGEDLTMHSNFAEDHFIKEINANPGNLNNYMLLANCYLINSKTSHALEILDKAIKLAPESSYILYQLMQVYYILKNRTDYSRVFEKIKKNANLIPLALFDLFNEAINNGQFDKAHEYIDKLDKVSKNKERVLSSKIKLSIAKKEFDNLINMIDNAYEQYPYSSEIFNYKFIIEKDVKKDIFTALKIIENYVDKFRNSDLIDELAKMYIDAGKISAYTNLMEELSEENPDDLSPIYKIAILNFDKGEFKDAIKYFLESLKFAPYVAAYHHELGNAYKELGEIDKAKDTYKKALNLNPYHYTVREKLRRLENKKPIFEYLPTPDLNAIYEENKEKYIGKGNNVAFLREEVQSVVYGGSAYEEKNYVLIQALNAEGIDLLKEYYVSYYSNQEYRIEKAEVLKKNGSIIKPEIDGSHIVFTNLEVGDAIAVIYSIRNYNIGSLSKYFWDRQTLEYSYPLLEKNFTILIPKDEKFSYFYHNGDNKPQISDFEDWKSYKWTKKDGEAAKQEKYSPASSEFSESIEISSIPEWNTINKWYYSLYHSKAKSTFETREVIKDIFPNGVPKDTLTALKEIYTYIVNNIRYSYVSFRQSGIIPQKSSSVINSRIGDCKDVSTLFVSLCSEIGVNSNIVLVSTRDYGRKYLKLPSILFNHAIATVTVNGIKYYVELTSDKLPFGAIGYNLTGCLTLEINPNIKSELTLLYPKNRNQNLITRQSVVEIQENEFTVTKKTLKCGNEAFNSRSSYRDITDKEREEKLARAIGSDLHNMKLISFKFDENLSTIGDSVTYNYTYKAIDPYNSIGSMSSFVIPFSDLVSPIDALSTDEREYDIDILDLFDVDIALENMTIIIPDNKIFIEIPKNIDYSSDFGNYQLTFNLQNQKLLISRKLEIKKDYAPAANFSKFKEFMNVVVKNDKTQLLLKSK